MKTFTLLAKILNCRRQRQISPLPIYYIWYNYILYCKVGGKANTCLRHQLSFSHCALSPEHPARKSCKILCIVDNTVDKIVVKIFVNIVVKIVVNIVVKIVVNIVVNIVVKIIVKVAVKIVVKICCQDLLSRLVVNIINIVNIFNMVNLTNIMISIPAQGLLNLCQIFFKSLSNIFRCASISWIRVGKWVSG